VCVVCSYRSSTGAVQGRVRQDVVGRGETHCPNPSFPPSSYIFKVHFGFLPRDTPHIAEALMNMAETDLESGMLYNRITRFLAKQDLALRNLVDEEGARAKARTVEGDKRRRRLQAASGGGRARLTEEDRAAGEAVAQALVVEADADLLREAKAEVARVQASLEATITALEKAKLDMKRVEQRMMSRLPEGTIQTDDRTAWNNRLLWATSLPEESNFDILAKYREIQSVQNDFQYCATSYAKVIIDERFLPDEDKSLKPFRNDTGDRHNILPASKRPKWLVSNIWFKFATDEHGLHNGSDEDAAKAAGVGLLGSIMYLKCHLDNLVVPMQAIVDHRGYEGIVIRHIQCSDSYVHLH